MASTDPKFGEDFAAAVRLYLQKNKLTSLGKINAPILADLAQRFYDHHEDQRRLKKNLLSDKEWLADLVADEVYRVLDVRQQHALALRWCKSNQRQCTRRFFEGTWLPRALKEAVTSPSAAGPNPKKIAPECPGWKVILNHEFPDSKFSAGGVLETDDWNKLPDYVQDLIWKAYKKT